ncbi:hypothetical protein Vadar_015623 [Vaccinium darrowii]|uniref:Uncharacterized protein n=1 Tax=Vaccinium darrowii TaxID=229202 RepID=A0ACB7XIG4_9ERIC|nr:hypothetical protein Vadar_015623 [Vaccinium darrowii]
MTHANKNPYLIQQRLRYRRREESDDDFVLLEYPTLDISLEDLHFRDEPLHLIKTAAQLGFLSPGSLQQRLGLGQTVPWIVDHGGGRGQEGGRLSSESNQGCC